MRINDFKFLAPLMRIRVENFIMQSLKFGYHIRIHETLRTNELQMIYYEQGTTKAATAEGSWHFYGLAIDFVHREFDWFTGKSAKLRWPNAVAREKAGVKWFTDVAQIGKDCGLDWGGDWNRPDYPHMQFDTLKKSPSNLARTLYKKGFMRNNSPFDGRYEVHRAVGAI